MKVSKSKSSILFGYILALDSQNFTNTLSISLSPMKICESKCNRKTKKKKKKKFWFNQKFLLRAQSQWYYDTISKFSQKVIEWFLKKRSLYFTSPMKIFKYKCNSKTPKKRKNPFNFDSIQNSFWMHKVTCIRMIFTRFHKKIIWVVFEKSSLYFTSHENF